MMDLLTFSFLPPLAEAIIFFGVLTIFQWMGRQYRLYRIQKHKEDDAINLGAAETSLIGLTALMLAFSFNLTVNKFEKRRDTIVEEASSIRAAIFQSSLYPDSIRVKFSKDFRDYIEAIIAYYDAMEDDAKVTAAMNDANRISGKISSEALSYYRKGENLAATYAMIPAINNMNDELSKREASRRFVAPRLIILILVLLMLLSGFLSGYGAQGKKRNFILILSFSVMTTLALYLILELDRPRAGYINVNEAEKQIIELRQMIPGGR
jgi:hypothetical protein